jgi:hypothetical protein
MDITVAIQLINGVGFPIFVCVWLLFRSDKKEEETAAVLSRLSIAIERLVGAEETLDNKAIKSSIR